MANSISTNPIILDTVGSTSVIDQNVTIRLAVWSGYSLGHTLSLTNASGTKEIIGLTASIAGNPIVLPFKNFIIPEGIALKTLGGGKLYLYRA